MFESVFDLSLVIGYLVGSIPCSFLVSRLAGIKNISKVGSKNVGATNVFRMAGKKPALLALLLDMSKPLVGLGLLVLFKGLSAVDSTSFSVVALGALLGHMFSMWLLFKGGKGVSVLLGYMIFFSPVSALVTVGFWILVLMLTRGLAGLASVLAVVVACVVHTLVVFPNFGISEVIFVFMCALVIAMHWKNLMRLVQGKENKLDLSFISKRLSAIGKSDSSKNNKSK